MQFRSLMAVAALTLSLQSVVRADTLPALMPLPSSVSQASGEFLINADFSIAYGHPPDERLSSAVSRMLLRLQYATGLPVAHAPIATGRGALTIDVAGPDPAVQGLDEDESYALAVTPQAITLSSPSVVGAMHGLETLLQLVEFSNGQAIVPAITIDDHPRFRWRGLMMDTARHFEPVGVIKRNLDGMALVKLNVFHWHLSDDQAFRVESKSFPKLTALGSRGEFYTQQQVLEVIAYARARGIRVVPEFDMPGHTLAWQVAYPEIGSAPGPFQMPESFGVHDEALDPTRPGTYKFLDSLISEMTALFPDAYFHIGGDESNGKAWLANPKIVAFMKAHKIATTEALQVYFSSQLLKIVVKHGKHMIGWDEVFTPGLPKDVVIESWRGEKSLAEAATQGYQGILAAPYYLDAMRSAETNYLADPVPTASTLTAEQRKLVLGGEIAMWAEQLHEETIDSRIWPRAAVIAERFWSPQSDRDVVSMYTRLQPISLQLESVGLTHISGPQKMLRNLARSQYPVELAALASVLEPLSLHGRYQSQHTDIRTPLDRLVDAVTPDPPSRFEISQAVAAALSSNGNATAARQLLQARFQSWVDASRPLAAQLSASPRLADAAPRAQQLGQLGQAGLEALGVLSGKPLPAGWEEQQSQLLTEAAKPVAITSFVFLPSMQRLIEAAAVKQ